MSKKNCLLFFLFFFIKKLDAGTYGDVYSAHPSAGAMGNAVTATINNSSAVYYNVAGLGRTSQAEIAVQIKEQNDLLIKLGGIREEKLVKKKEDELKKIPGFKGIVYRGYYNFASEKEQPLPKRLVNELNLQYYKTQPSLKFTGRNSQDTSKVEDDFAVLGLTINLNHFIDLKRNFRFGLNIMLPTSGNLLSINDLNPTTPRFLQHGYSNQRPIIMGGAGIELWKNRLFAGVGFNALVSGRGSALLKDVDIDPKRTTPDQQVVLDVKPFVNPIFGLMFTYGRLNIGSSYRREMILNINEISARAQTRILGIQFDVDLAILDHFSPKLIAYGFGYRITDRIQFNFDTKRELWSEFKLSRAKEKYSEPVLLRDVSNHAAGIEFALTEFFKFKAGFGKRYTPIRDSFGTTNFIDFNRIVSSIGFSYSFIPKSESIIRSPIILDFMIQQQSLASNVVYKYRPNFDNQNYVSGGKVYAFGFSISLLF